jgi:hypothetical protein
MNALKIAAVLLIVAGVLGVSYGGLTQALMQPGRSV